MVYKFPIEPSFTQGQEGLKIHKYICLSYRDLMEQLV